MWHTSPWIQSSIIFPARVYHTTSQCCLSPSISFQPIKFNTLSCTLLCCASENCRHSTTWKASYVEFHLLHQEVVFIMEVMKCLFWLSQHGGFVFWFLVFDVFPTLGAGCKKSPASCLASGIQNIFKVIERLCWCVF